MEIANYELLLIVMFEKKNKQVNFKVGVCSGNSANTPQLCRKYLWMK